MIHLWLMDFPFSILTMDQRTAPIKEAVIILHCLSTYHSVKVVPNVALNNYRSP